MNRDTWLWNNRSIRLSANHHKVKYGKQYSLLGKNIIKTKLWSIGRDVTQQQIEEFIDDVNSLSFVDKCIYDKGQSECGYYRSSSITVYYKQ